MAELLAIGDTPEAADEAEGGDSEAPAQPSPGWRRVADRSAPPGVWRLQRPEYSGLLFPANSRANVVITSPPMHAA